LRAAGPVRAEAIACQEYRRMLAARADPTRATMRAGSPTACLPSPITSWNNNKTARDGGLQGRRQGHRRRRVANVKGAVHFSSLAFPLCGRIDLFPSPLCWIRWREAPEEGSCLRVETPSPWRQSAPLDSPPSPTRGEGAAFYAAPKRHPAESNPSPHLGGVRLGGLAAPWRRRLTKTSGGHQSPRL